MKTYRSRLPVHDDRGKKKTSKPTKSVRSKSGSRGIKHTSRALNTPFRIYTQSLAPGGRQGMYSMLKIVCQLLNWHGRPDNYPWESLHYQDVQTIRTGLLEQGYAINSINLALSGIKNIAKVAFNLELMDAQKLMRIQSVPAVKGSALRKGKSLQKDEIRHVLNNLKHAPNKVKSTRDKALFLVGCTAGLRCSELVALDKKSFDPQSGSLKVLHAKGRKQRELFLCQQTQKALADWLKLTPSPQGHLFTRVSKKGLVSHQSLSPSGIAAILRRLALSSGIERFSPHDMRRTFITQLLNNGEDLNTVRQLAGHASINTTVVYDRRGEEALIQASRNIRF